MTDLTAKQEAFILKMSDSTELAQRGFDMLLKRPNFDRFFDALRQKGLFDPDRNPAPEPADQEGYFRIPYWNALDYLKRIAQLAGEREDRMLSAKIIEIVRSVTAYQAADGARRDNYHTARRFAEILGLLPLDVLKKEDLDALVPVWLASRFDGGRMVGHAFDEGVLGRLLQSESPDDWENAVVILRHCTALRWEADDTFGKSLKPRMAVEDHSIQELMRHHAADFGRRAGVIAAPVLVERVREVFSAKPRDTRSSVYRPAIEDHEQNHRFRVAENVSVSGLRDVLLHWCERESPQAQAFIAECLKDDLEIVRRIGIYLLDQRWEALRGLYTTIVGPGLFDWGHLHELYGLLQRHFAHLEPAERTATLEAIRGIPAAGVEGEQLRELRRTQRHWLSAVAGKGDTEADAWLGQLETDATLGRLSNHSDFHSYLESWSGPGPSPYEVQELVALARSSSVIETLNAFEQADDWRGPSIRSLVDALEQAVKQEPVLFLNLLPKFLGAKRPYQYGVINGLKEVWNASHDKPVDVEWVWAWQQLFSFLEPLLNAEVFWAEEVERQDLVPTRDWIPPVVAEILKAGTRSDQHAYSPALLPRGWNLLTTLLQKSKGVESASEEDPMTQAINSTRGKAVEALFVHALRECRLADATSGNHTDAWAFVRPTFDAELAKCSNGNYEFSTLCGAYLANLDYMSPHWLAASVKTIFPEVPATNTLCAVCGLAYASATRRIYVLLRNSGVIDWAIRTEMKARHAREKLMQRIALAYLWGEDDLDSSRWSYLFATSREEDLVEAARYFWSVQGEKLSEEQRERIVGFWGRAIVLGPAPPEKLMASLATLSTYLRSADGKDRELLLAIAPYVHLEHATHDFLEQLQRLVKVSPEGVSEVLARLLQSHVPSYDYEDRLKSLLTTLAGTGQKQKEDALRYAEMARSLHGVEELFKELAR